MLQCQGEDFALDCVCEQHAIRFDIIGLEEQS